MGEIARPRRRNKLKAAFLAQDYEHCSDISRATGFCRASIYACLRGRTFPSGDLQHAMCRVLGISLRDLRELL
jgi:hypothetical protein